MSRVVALLTPLALLVAITLPAKGDSHKGGPNSALLAFIATPFTSNAESKVMAKNLMSQYVEAPINLQSVVESTDEAIAVNFERAELPPQIRSLVKELDDGLGKQVAQSSFMQQNLSNLLSEMGSTLESNARMKQESAHTLRFGAAYWTIVYSSLFFAYHVARVIEQSGHDAYALIANVSLLLGIAKITSFGMEKIWKSPSEKSPKTELAQWQNELIKDIHDADLKYCKTVLTL